MFVVQVRSWFMDEKKEDPQEDHFVEEVDVSTMCQRSGVEVWYFHPDQIVPGNECPTLLKLKQDRG